MDLSPYSFSRLDFNRCVEHKILKVLDDVISLTPVPARESECIRKCLNLRINYLIFAPDCRKAHLLINSVKFALASMWARINE